MALFLFPNTNFGQTPNLGRSADFGLFTSSGEFNNSGPTVVIGEVGTNAGVLTGFPPGTATVVHSTPDAVTAQAKIDLGLAYTDLAGRNCAGNVINVLLHLNPILGPGTYCTNAAASLDGNLTLDGQGNSNSLFIIQIDGALATTTGSTITLINSASFCNVYWQISGAVDLGINSLFQGTIVSGGAISLYTGAALNGRGLTRAGAISSFSNLVNSPPCVPPVVTCPIGVEVSCTNQLPAFDLASVVAIDNCGGSATITFVSDVITGLICPNQYTITRTYLATVLCGASQLCTQIITVNDQTAPTIVCPTVISPIQCSAIPIFPPATATDLCGSVPTITFIDVTVQNDVTRTWTATDNCGNASMCDRTITVNDQTAPTIVCPTVISPIQCPAIPIFPPATATDLCDASPIITFADVTLQNSVTRTWTATDNHGNASMCNRTIVVEGNTLPTITCPSNIVKNTDLNLCSAVVNYVPPTFSSNCYGVTLTLTSGLVSGSAFPKGINMVTFAATDQVGNMAVCGFTVTVNDNQIPTIACPGNIVRNTDVGRCDAIVVTYVTPTALDNCSLPLGQPMWISGGTVSFASGLNSISTFLKGVTIVQWKATDGVGLMKLCTFTVTVNDNQQATITCPSNQAKNTDPNLCTAIVTYAPPTAIDNCPPPLNVVIQSGLPSGSPFPKGITTVVWKATDAAGLMKTCFFRVTVNDTQLPGIICPILIVKNTDANQCSAVVTYAMPAFTDNCPGGSLVRLSGLISGSAFPKGVNVVVWKATDASGNIKTCSFTVTVIDAQLPIITCPANIVKSNDPNLCCAAVTYPAPATTDNCRGVIPMLMNGLASGSPFPLGVSNVVWKATDAMGLTQTCLFTVTINDTQGPMVMCPGNITVIGTGTPCGYPSASLPVAIVMMENCPDGYTLTSNAPTTLTAGPNVITWTATDAANNVSICAYTVTVSCPTAPQGDIANTSREQSNITPIIASGLVLVIFPNPVTSQVTFRLDGMSEQGGELTIFDQLGHIAWQQSVTAEQVQVSLDVHQSNFASGVYKVRLLTERGVVTKGLVINEL